MTQIEAFKLEAFKNYFDVVAASGEAKIEWAGSIVTVTIERHGKKLVRRFNAYDVNLYDVSGSRYADILYKKMIKSMEED